MDEQAAAAAGSDPNEVVVEHHHQFDDLPVAICVLETRGGFFAVGSSAVNRGRFDADIAQAFARKNARRELERILRVRT